MGDYGCDQPELRLRLGHGSSTDDSDPIDRRTTCRVDGYNWYESALQQQQQRQQITVIYNGRMCVCDVTEIQARAIICMAKREMDERIERRHRQQRGGVENRSRNHPSPLPAAVLVPQLINPDLSMKRSLQRFLQKRKYRNIDASAPYSLAPDTPSPSSSSS